MWAWRPVATGVTNNQRDEPVLAGVEGAGPHASTRRHADDDHGVDAARRERRRERRAKKRARVLLCDHHVTDSNLQWRHQLSKPVPGFETSQRRDLAEEHAAVDTAVVVRHLGEQNGYGRGMGSGNNAHRGCEHRRRVGVADVERGVGLEIGPAHVHNEHGRSIAKFQTATEPGPLVVGAQIVIVVGGGHRRILARLRGRPQDRYRRRMAEETLRTVVELLDEQSSDNTEWFDQLWGLTSELRARVDARFPDLARDPSSLPYDRYASKSADGPNGHMTTWTSPEVDWMVNSNLTNTKLGFCNMHLTLWLGPQIKVPHLAFAFGTFPDLFFLCDFPARADTVIDTASLYRYNEPVNERWLGLRAHPNLRPFTSRSLYVRETLSETAFCYLADRTDENMALYRDLAHELLGIWLGWVDAAEQTPDADRADLAQRDLMVRRYVAELDPANVLAVRYFGQEREEALVRQLWGGDRTHARVGGFSNTCPPPSRPGH